MCVRADDGARQRYQLSAGRVRFFLKKVLPTSTHPYGIKAALSKKKKMFFQSVQHLLRVF